MRERAPYAPTSRLSIMALGASKHKNSDNGGAGGAVEQSGG